MRVGHRSIQATIIALAIVLAAACRGADGADRDSASLETPGAWNESMVFGFADAAFSLLLDDSEIGARLARRAQVRQLATRMQRDYRALLARTDSLSDRRNVVPRLPAGFDFIRHHRAAAVDLRNEDQRPFDDRYLEHVFTGHQRVMDRMYEALSAAQDSSVRRLLEDAQQRIETNLAEAVRLKNLGGRTTSRPR
jgi:predicted outer membrane protein